MAKGTTEVNRQITIASESSRQVTVATVLVGLRQEILLGTYGGERQISENEVAQKYHVSRSTVRSVFQTLERDGLLEIQPNGRKLLKKVDQKYIQDLCFTRSILECEAVRLIIRQKATDFSALLQLVGEFYSAEQEPAGQGRRMLLAHLNDKFHDQMFLMAENSALLQCRRTIAPMLTAIADLNSALDPDLNVHGYYESHKKITEMLMERDEAAIEYIRYHAADATAKDILLVLQKMDQHKIEK